MKRIRLSSAHATPQAGVPDCSAATSSAPDFPDPWLEVLAAGVITSPLAGEAGLGGTAVLRRQPVLIAESRVERRHRGAFEPICRECGDNPYLDSSRLQQIRGPYTITAGLAAYQQHLGLPVSDSLT